MWLRSLFVVTVDDQQSAKPTFYAGQARKFTFLHEGRLIQDTVEPVRKLIAGRVSFKLRLDGQQIANGTVPIQNWRLAFVGVLSVTVVCGAFLSLFTYFEIDKVIDRWIEQQL